MKSRYKVSLVFPRSAATKSLTLLTIARFDVQSFTSIRIFRFAFLSSVFFEPYIWLTRLKVFVLKSSPKKFEVNRSTLF